MSDAGVSMEGEAPSGWTLRWLGVVVGLALALLPMMVRLQTPLDLLPYWEGDPLNQESVVIGLTPPMSLIGDIVSVAGAGLLFACGGGRRRVWAIVPLALAAAGVWACFWHLSGGSGRDGKSLVTGGSWVSAVTVALALWFAGADRRLRLIAFAIIVGSVGLLACKGLYQVMVEHPATVEAFRRDKEAILARNGWQPESSMARAYERRLMQSEATGWFGFANVYASFAAMGFTVFGLSLLRMLTRTKEETSELDERSDRLLLTVVLGGTLLSGAALVMAGAKGGYAVAALGVFVGLLLNWLRGERRAMLRGWSWAVGPMVIALPLVAVVARGVVGERIGELSLLFRWFYMQGAARIFGANWMHGVGPDGFQSAYALAKNPLSPEDVTSPHSVLWDWAACLGIGGVALAVWLVWLGTRVGPAAARGSDPGDSYPGETRALMRVVCAVTAIGTIVAIPLQYAALLPEEAIGVRIGGLVVWCVLSCGLLAVARSWSGWSLALSAGAAAVLAHMQIEVSGVWIQSCGLLLALVALAASGCSGTNGVAPAARGRGIAAAVGLIGCAGAAFMLLSPFLGATHSYARLLRAYVLLEPVRDGRATLAAAVRDRSPQAPAIAQRLKETEPGLIAEAVQVLPRVWPSSRSASQLAMHLAQAYQGDRSASDSAARAQVWAALALMLVEENQDREVSDLLSKPSVGAADASAVFARVASLSVDELDTRQAAWGATICIAAADAGIGPGPAEWLRLGVKHLSRARQTDPYNPAHPLRIMDCSERLGLSAEAAAAARDVLTADALQRFDREARGLSDRDRVRVERLAGVRGGGVSPGSR